MPYKSDGEVETMSMQKDSSHMDMELKRTVLSAFERPKFWSISNISWKEPGQNAASPAPDHRPGTTGRPLVVSSFI